MTAQSKSDHLIERAARRLRAAGLSASDLLPDHTPDTAERSAGLRALDGGLPRALPAPGAHGPVPLGSVPLGPPMPMSVGAEAPSIVPDADIPSRPELPAGPTIDADHLERAGMINWGKTRSRLTEEFRVVQSQIVRNIPASGGTVGSNLVMITSARPGEGKSFAALNLAASMAQFSTRPVLLVDVDVKQHSLSYLLGLAEAPGVLELGSENARRPDPLFARTPFNNLSVLPIGSAASRAELSASTPIIGVVEMLARRYAHCVVLLDAPPCLASSEPSTLAHLVAQTVLVVEAERTQRNEVESALDLLQTCPNVMLLLNKTQVTSSDTFGAHGSYGAYGSSS